MAKSDARLNQVPIYVPWLGKAFRPGGWDYDKDAPTGAAGTEYEPGEWEAELAAVREAHVEAAAERANKANADTPTPRPRRARPTTKRTAKQDQADEQTPDETATEPSQTEE